MPEKHDAMFNSAVLNVVIGLVFIFLLYSLLASIIQELVAAWIGLRASVLRKGIARMLDDDETENGLSALFYKHPLTRYLGKDNDKRKPSYLSPQNFSKVLTDLLRGKSDGKPGRDFSKDIMDALPEGAAKWETTAIKPQTQSYLLSLWADAQGDVDKFNSLLEQWFDDTMERVSGWYKRKTQKILFFIGILLAVMFNVDTISIVRTLSQDPEMAARLAGNAAVYLQNHQASASRETAGEPGADVPAASGGKEPAVPSDSLLRKAGQLMDSANALIRGNIRDANTLLGLGWTVDKSGKQTLCIPCNFHWHSVFGWLITALAISLGAPFWFDLLNKLVKMRSSAGTSATDGKQNQRVAAISKIKRAG